MPYCPSCGKEVKEADQFCSHCGASIIPQVREAHDFRRGYMDERKACFGPSGSGVGLWGSLSGGVFLIGLIILWYYDLWWPGILVLIALMVIIGSIVAQTRRY